MQTEKSSKLISEMDASELMAKAKELNQKIDAGTITENEINQLNLARTLFKRKTGRMLNERDVRYS